MDRFESMAVLLAVVEAGSLSAAGRKLGMPLATVSRKISELETHVKARLLSRSTRRLALTDAGGAPMLGFDHLLVDLETRSVVEWAWTFASISVSRPRIDVALDASGRRFALPLTPYASRFIKAWSWGAVCDGASPARRQRRT